MALVACYLHVPMCVHIRIRVRVRVTNIRIKRIKNVNVKARPYFIKNFFKNKHGKHRSHSVMKNNRTSKLS